MPIYEKSTRHLLKDFVQERGLGGEQIITRDQIVSWFKTKYPKLKKATVDAHLIKMSVNAPSRFHYNANPNGEDDLFFQIDGSRFRLYAKDSDPPPIYTKGQSDTTETQHLVEGTDDNVDYGFAYERDLRNFLARNLHLIKPGLRLYEEEGITGIEFPVGGRLIDLLAIDNDGHYVVVELKVSRGYDRVIGQLLRYMAWIEKHHAEPHQDVRGVIVAREISDDLRLAASKLSGVSLFEYQLSVSLKEIPAY